MKVSDGWGEQEVFNVAEIWWAPPRRKGSVRTRLYAVLLGSGWVAGAAMAIVFAWWWMRG